MTQMGREREIEGQRDRGIEWRSNRSQKAEVRIVKSEVRMAERTSTDSTDYADGKRTRGRGTKGSRDRVGGVRDQQTANWELVTRAKRVGFVWDL